MEPTGLNGKVILRIIVRSSEHGIDYECSGGASDMLSHTLSSSPVMYLFKVVISQASQ